jgi:hypothetical protein
MYKFQTLAEVVKFLRTAGLGKEAVEEAMYKAQTSTYVEMSLKTGGLGEQNEGSSKDGATKRRMSGPQKGTARHIFPKHPNRFVPSVSTFPPIDIQPPPRKRSYPSNAEVEQRQQDMIVREKS